ncbi:MAG: tRNA (adenosine(37)-N6)-threonylcarbamoyltransferase complex dimerization subunit type 1 TsaB [Clostridiales bacterium]|nr:tRNA (adenosine(37)-N6)-threonylcarbamoyltransferase complex dimerization subunit type 1 TsaB [Clostridiales bacterium]
MKILAIDSSAKSVSAALVEDGKVICETFANIGLTHSETLMPMISFTLKSAKASPDDIDIYALTTGPGSFTGIRIGAAAVKGMAQAKDKKCVGVSSLEAIAFSYRDSENIVCAVMDARCSQVYCAAFRNGERLFEDKAILIEELCSVLEEYNEKTVFVGDGAKLVYDSLKDRLDCVRAKPENEFPHASSVALIAEKRADTAVPYSQIVPVYLRLPQAQRELNNKKEREDKK